MFRLKELRTHRNMSLRKLAIISGVSKSYISELEKGGIKNPSFSVTYQLAIALKVPPCELMGIDCLYQNVEK